MDVPSTSTDGERRAGRRMLLKGSALAGAGAAAYGWLSPGTGSAQTTTPSGPNLTPFVDPLPLPLVKMQNVLAPAPAQNPVPGEAGRDPHQRWAEFPPSAPTS